MVSWNRLPWSAATQMIDRPPCRSPLPASQPVQQHLLASAVIANMCMTKKHIEASQHTSTLLTHATQDSCTVDLTYLLLAVQAKVEGNEFDGY